MSDPMFVSPYLKRRLRSLNEVLAERAARTASPEPDDDTCTDDRCAKADEPWPELYLV